MIERLPETIIHPVGQTGWWYIEFLGPGSSGHPQNPTPGAQAGTSNPGGITGAQEWLNKTVTPGSNPVFGNIDSGGTVRLFWYGTIPLQFKP
jgi:hypothetical protein